MGGCFKGVHFAHRGGRKGTTKRLDAWCCRLSQCINTYMVPPVVVAQVLKLLEVPYGRAFSAEGTASPKSLTSTAVDDCTSASTTDVDNELESDGESYESDFETDSDDSGSLEE